MIRVSKFLAVSELTSVAVLYKEYHYHVLVNGNLLASSYATEAEAVTLLEKIIKESETEL